MNAETRKWLLENYRDADTRWLYEVDNSDEFEQKARDRKQRAYTLQTAYGQVTTYQQELQVRLQGANAETAGVNEKLIGVQSAVLTLFKSAPFGLPLKLLEVSRGSTVMHFVPEADGLVKADPIFDDVKSGGFVESAADKPSLDVLRMLRDIEKDNDIQRWQKALKGAGKLTAELQKVELDASFIWYSSSGNVEHSKYTEVGRNHYFATVNKVDKFESSKPVSGRILSMVSKENGLVEVHIKTGSNRNSTAYDVLINSSVLRDMRVFLGDSVSWLVRSSIEKNGLGETVSQRFVFQQNLEHNLHDSGALFQ